MKNHGPPGNRVNTGSDRVRIHDVYIEFCRENGFNFREDLLPQFLKAFEDKGEDYEQIIGSVSYNMKILINLSLDESPSSYISFRMLPW